MRSFSPDELRAFWRFRLDQNLFEIAGDGGTRAVVLSLLTQCESEGRLLEVVEAFIEERPAYRDADEITQLRTLLREGPTTERRSDPPPPSDYVEVTKSTWLAFRASALMLIVFGLYLLGRQLAGVYWQEEIDARQWPWFIAYGLPVPVVLLAWNRRTRDGARISRPRHFAVVGLAVAASSVPFFVAVARVVLGQQNLATTFHTFAWFQALLLAVVISFFAWIHRAT